MLAVENDSVDDTKIVLSNWKKTSNSITILSDNYGVETIIETEDGVDKFFSNHRISHMSSLTYLYFTASFFYTTKYIDAHKLPK